MRGNRKAADPFGQVRRFLCLWVRWKGKARNRGSAPGVLGGVGQALGLVVGDVGDAEIFEDLEEGLAAVGEGHGAVVGVALLDEHMAVEAAHLGDGKDTDAAEGPGGHGEDLALGDVGAQAALAVALEAVEGDLAGGDVALQGAPGKVGLAAILQQAVLDELVLHGAAAAQLAAGGIAAVEAHEGVLDAVVEPAGDVLVVDVLGDGVVDVQQGDGVAGDAGADVLAQRAVDVHLAGHGDAPGGQAGVHVAGLKAELLREGGPALVGEGHVLPGALVVLGPVQEGELKLGHPLQQVGVDPRHLGLHVGGHLGDALVTGVGLIGHQQVQLGVLLDLHAQLIEALDGGVAGEEVLGPGTEGDDLQVFDADDGPGDGNEVTDHVGALLGGTHGVLGQVGLQVAHAQVIGAVEHAAVGVAAAIDHVAIALGGGHVHGGAVELLAQQGLGGLGAEVAQEDHQGVDAVGLHVLQGLEGVQLVLHGDGALVETLAVSRDDVLPALGGQGDGEAVPGDRDDAQLDFRNIHSNTRSFFHYITKPIISMPFQSIPLRRAPRGYPYKNRAKTGLRAG